jgi:hypothetical protein
MAPQKQNASYELIETGGDYGAVEPASTDAADEEYDKYDGGETPRRKLGTHAVLAKKPKGLYAGLWKAQSGTEKKGYLSAEECRRHIDKACPTGCPIPRERPLLRTVSLPAPRPAIQDDNDLIYRPAPAAVEQVVELHGEE